MVELEASNEVKEQIYMKSSSFIQTLKVKANQTDLLVTVDYNDIYYLPTLKLLKAPSIG